MFRTEEHHWAGSSVDDLRSWLRKGGVARARTACARGGRGAPFDAWMEASGRSRDEIAAAYELVNAWLEAVLPPPDAN